VYVIHEGETPKLVATVATIDGEGGQFSLGDPGGSGDWVANLGERSAHVTADGRELVFVSAEDLTGFHTEGGREIYMYDFGAEKVSCVSCSPTGTSTIHNPRAGEFDDFAHGEFPLSGSPAYVLRDVSAGGDRVFFQSRERLVPQETYEGQPGPFISPNGPANVYEWERDGTGSCVRPAGCVYLLSGGTSTGNSSFVDASETGDDVFIETRAQLVPQDHGETYEVYDARVGGTAPPAEPRCSGSGCQGVPGAPPLFSAPASATATGGGNFAAQPPQPPPSSKSKPLTKKQELARALRACHAKYKPKTRRRISCERAARAAYRAATARFDTPNRKGSR
jgi:hypothetical protein